MAVWKEPMCQVSKQGIGGMEMTPCGRDPEIAPECRRCPFSNNVQDSCPAGTRYGESSDTSREIRKECSRLGISVTGE